MTRTEFDAYCSSLKSATHVVQWGDSSVWKIGGKIFAICSSWGADEEDKISFKCSDLSYKILSAQDGIVPAPYLARAKWVQLVENTALNDDEIRSYIQEAYVLISRKLTRAARAELGL